jgi:hypothetical protein
LETEVNKLRDENKEIKDKLDYMTLKINKAEQDNLNDTCIIHGTTKQNDENLNELVCTVAKSLNCDLDIDDIVKCSRMNPEPNKPSTIVLKLKTKEKQKNSYKLVKTHSSLETLPAAH